MTDFEYKTLKKILKDFSKDLLEKYPIDKTKTYEQARVDFLNRLYDRK